MLVAEPFYESYAKYSAINIAASMRSYFKLSKKSRFFANFGFTVGSPFNAKVELELTEEFEIKPFVRFSAGAGYNFNNRISVEARQLNALKFSDKPSYRLSYQSEMICLGYKLFQTKNNTRIP